jgi:translation initiation factor IF-1
VKKKKFIVDNRQGDKVSFVFIKDTEVSGKKKLAKKIKKGDWVTVSWRFVDKPRKAYKIVVLPPREEDD